MKLLIVEDNAAVRRIIRTVAAPFADEIAECADGREALLRYADNRPDCVLMDLDLGETDGITTTGEIRKLDPSARVVIVTNYNKEDLREAAELAGACGYVLKENLFDIVRFLKP